MRDTTARFCDGGREIVLWIWFESGIDFNGVLVVDFRAAGKFLAWEVLGNSMVTEILGVLQVKHLQSNGHVERANRSLREGIKAHLGEENKNWIEELTHVFWAHRTMIKSSHGDTPFSLTYGTEAVIPAEIGMPTYRITAVDAVHNDEELRPGDFVYRSNDTSHAVDGGKLGLKWKAPYETEKSEDDASSRLLRSKSLPSMYNLDWPYNLEDASSTLRTISIRRVSPARAAFTVKTIPGACPVRSGLGCAWRKSWMLTLGVASASLGVFSLPGLVAGFVTVVTMEVVLAIALIFLRVIPSVKSHEWRQLVDTKVMSNLVWPKWAAIRRSRTAYRWPLPVTPEGRNLWLYHVKECVTEMVVGLFYGLDAHKGFVSSCYVFLVTSDGFISWASVKRDLRADDSDGLFLFGSFFVSTGFWLHGGVVFGLVGFCISASITSGSLLAVVDNNGLVVDHMIDSSMLYRAFGDCYEVCYEECVLNLNPKVFEFIVDRCRVTGSLDKCVELMVGHKEFVCSNLCFNSVLRDLVKCGNLKLFWEVCGRMSGKEGLFDVYTYTNMIKAHCMVGDVDKAKRVLDEMSGKGVEPSVVTAVRVKDEMIASPVGANLVVYNTLLYGLCKEHMMDKAVLIDCLMKYGYLEDVSGLLIELHSKSIVCNHPSVSSLVLSLCKKQKVEEAYKLVKNGAVNSSIFTYNILIKGFFKIGNVDRAKELFEEIKEKGLSPDHVTYGTMIIGFCKSKGVTEACELLDEMLQMGLSPSCYLYNAVVDCCHKTGDSDKAKDLCQKMTKKGYVLTSSFDALNSKDQELERSQVKQTGSTFSGMKIFELSNLEIKS
nr:hypothetical protein [Tanacetum cinerariifolium]